MARIAKLITHICTHLELHLQAVDDDVLGELLAARAQVALPRRAPACKGAARTPGRAGSSSSSKHVVDCQRAARSRQAVRKVLYQRSSSLHRLERLEAQ